jgi:hypothetical protein
MYKYYVSFCNEQGDWEDPGFGSDNLRTATSETRDLQRILSPDRKGAGCYYAVFERIVPDSSKLIYSARGR